MKRARVMSTVAMAFFILSLFAMAVSETMRYVLLFNFGGSADYVTIVRDVLTFELPMLFGLVRRKNRIFRLLGGDGGRYAARRA